MHTFFSYIVMAKDTSSLPLNLVVICIILATGAKTPEATESLHSGPVQDQEHRHHNPHVCAAVVSNGWPGRVAHSTHVFDQFALIRGNIRARPGSS